MREGDVKLGTGSLVCHAGAGSMGANVARQGVVTAWAYRGSGCSEARLHPRGADALACLDFSIAFKTFGLVMLGQMNRLKLNIAGNLLIISEEFIEYTSL